MIKEFVTYKVHVHKANHEDLYRLLESMPKAIRGIFIREAIAHYARTKGRLVVKLETASTENPSLQRTFDQDFGGPA